MFKMRLDVILRKGHSVVFISCKMTDLAVEAINELEVYANHFAGDNCLKIIVCSGRLTPFTVIVVRNMV